MYVLVQKLFIKVFLRQTFLTSKKVEYAKKEFDVTY